jgi:hypothetical protein
VKFGVTVAIPAVPVSGWVVGAWIGEAVVVPESPEKLTNTCIVCAVVS